MEASEMIKEIEKAINKVGDLDVVMVHPTGVEYYVEICTKYDYVGGGDILFSNDSLANYISIDWFS